jgi:hypothetical protein
VRISDYAQRPGIRSSQCATSSSVHCDQRTYCILLLPTPPFPLSRLCLPSCACLCGLRSPQPGGPRAARPGPARERKRGETQARGKASVPPSRAPAALRPSLRRWGDAHAVSRDSQAPIPAKSTRRRCCGRTGQMKEKKSRCIMKHRASGDARVDVAKPRHCCSSVRDKRKVTTVFGLQEKANNEQKQNERGAHLVHSM